LRIHRRLSHFAALSLLTFSFALPAAAEPNEASVAGVTTSRIRIDNFGRVSPAYYRGAQPKGSDYADLAALGVTTVINLTSDDAQANEREQVERAGMKYVQIPMTTHRPPTSAQLAQFFAIVNDPNSGPVYVHCVGGKHRTGVMTAAYRMTNDGWTSEQAFREMKQYKFGADFLHPEFKKYVFAFRADPKPATPTNTVVATTTVVH
jgi:protein tyrosine/serine phosphatase